MFKTVVLLSILLLSNGEYKEQREITLEQNQIEYETDSGWLSAYDREPFEATYDYRLEIGDIEPGYDVYLAVSDCSRMSETGLIFFRDSTVETYQVFDCAKRNNEDGTKTWMEQNGIVAEIDYFSWQRHKKLGKATIVPFSSIRKN